MNINRLLSRRDKDGSSHSHRRQKSREKSSDKKARPRSNDGISTLFKSDPQKKFDKEQSVKMQKIKQRLFDQGYTGIEDEQINYALLSKHANGNVDRAYELVVLFQESVEGVIKSYNPAVHMWGAENREGVTCYLDSLLFAMFARLGSFEPILYTIFEDEPRRRLSTLIRLWVNMLRTGMLIQTDITEHLQDALATCGWKDAAKLEQQDTSEAFSFITGILQLPLLTLKMDIYHTGTEDAKDDHKFIHERLLEVAVPEDPGTGRPIQLEDCLESYFNNRIEVVRRLERSTTLSSVRSGRSEKGETQHVEVTELTWSTPDTPISLPTPGTPISPGTRTRATSIIRRRLIEDEKGDVYFDSDSTSTRPSMRKGSIRKEVLMPAWQFFNLIPWYTKNSPTNDAEVAAHFSQTRPVLGICLKRYAMSADGHASRRNTFIDIPLDIRLPHFIQDDMIPEEGPSMGNFKLSLQSVICHRGRSVQSGHYVSFIRGITEVADGDSDSTRKLSSSSLPPRYPTDRWIKFDDLAEPERVSYADMDQALKDEMPYLLFYQVQPTYDESPQPGPEILLPTYSNSNTAVNLINSHADVKAEHPHQQGYFDGAKDEPNIRLSTEIDNHRRSINFTDGFSQERRGSLAFTEPSMGSAASSIRPTDIISAPVTPTEESTVQRMSRAAARFAKSGSKSRPTSATGENRLSTTISRLSLMRSKEQLVKIEVGKDTTNHVNGAAELHNSVPVDPALLKLDPGAVARSQSKGGKHRDRSKGPLERKEHGHHHHHQHSHKGKENAKARDIPDRECMIM